MPVFCRLCLFFLPVACLWGCVACPASKKPPPSPTAQEEKGPESGPAKDRRTQPEKVLDIAETNDGYLFVDGLFIPAPYKVKVKGLTALVNGRKVYGMSPPDVPDPEKQKRRRKERLASLPKAKREHQGKVYHARDVIFENHSRWEDFHGREEATGRLKALLGEESRKGRMPEYGIDDDGTLVLLINPWGPDEIISLHSMGVPLGPPYKQYDVDSARFAERVAELAKYGGFRYGPEGAKKILSNFLSSQKEVKEFRFASDGLVVTRSNGAERVLLLKYGTAEEALRERYEGSRHYVSDRARHLVRRLDDGGLVLINTTGTEYLPADDLGTLRLIWKVLSARYMSNWRRARRLARHIPDDIARQIVRHAGENLPLLHDAVAGLNTDE